MTITEQDIERAREYLWENGRYTHPSYRPAAKYAAHVTADLRQQLAEKDAHIASVVEAIQAYVGTIHDQRQEITSLHSALTAAEERAAETLSLLNAETATHRNTKRRNFELRKSIVLASAKFRQYEKLHVAKMTAESIGKARVNGAMANMLDEVLHEDISAAPCTEDK